MRAALTIFAIWAAGLGAAAQFGKISVAYEALGRAYAAQAGIGIGVMVSIVGMVGLIFGTTAGLLVARIGARRAMVGALALGAAVSAVQMLFPPYPVMMVSRLLEGVSHLVIVVVGPTAIAGLTAARWQGAVMTLWSSFFAVTYAALFFFGPPLVAASGPGALFGLHALWMAACGGILWALLPADAPEKAGALAGSLWAEHRRIYASPWVAAPATGFVCYTMTYVAVLTLLPAMMPEQGAFVGVAMPLVSIVVSLTFGVWLLGRMSAVHLVQAGFGLAVLSGLGLWLGWGGTAALVFALGVAGSLGIVQGASFAALAQLNATSEDRAQAAGAIAQLGNLGTTCGTPILVWLTERAGSLGLVLFVTGFSALGIAIHALQARRRALSVEPRRPR